MKNILSLLGTVALAGSATTIINHSNTTNLPATVTNTNASLDISKITAELEKDTVKVKTDLHNANFISAVQDTILTKLQGIEPNSFKNLTTNHFTLDIRKFGVPNIHYVDKNKIIAGLAGFSEDIANKTKMVFTINLENGTTISFNNILVYDLK